MKKLFVKPKMEIMSIEEFEKKYKFIVDANSKVSELIAKRKKVKTEKNE